MRDAELYQQLLALTPPWTVTRVALDVAAQRVDVWADAAPGTTWPCPTCGQRLPTYDHAPERAWRHLDSCQFQTFLHARPPRVKCAAHGVHQVRLPWAEPHARFTTLFEGFALVVLRGTDVARAAAILRLTWDEAWHLIERAVARGQAAQDRPTPTHLGVDETAIARGPKYATLVYDLDRGTVVYLALERQKASLAGYYASLTAEQRAQIAGVAMDLWAPFREATLAAVPEAAGKIVYDRFHVMQIVTDALDTVRAAEHRARRRAGDRERAAYRRLWLTSRENLSWRQRRRLAALRKTRPQTARAWRLKEQFRQLWDFTREGWARRFWDRWYARAVRSRLPPLVRAAQRLKLHLPYIFTYFTHRLTNAVAEGLNDLIATLQKRAYGYRNFEHFKTVVFFHCGGLQLEPATHKHPG